MPRAAANWSRSAGVKYFWKTNRRSSSLTCWLLNAVRDFRRRPRQRCGRQPVELILCPLDVAMKEHRDDSSKSGKNQQIKYCWVSAKFMGWFKRKLENAVSMKYWTTGNISSNCKVTIPTHMRLSECRTHSSNYARVSLKISELSSQYGG